MTFEVMFGTLDVCCLNFLRAGSLLMANTSTLAKKEIISNIVTKEVDDIPPKYSNFSNKLVKMLLTKDVKKRPKIQEILELSEINLLVS